MINPNWTVYTYAYLEIKENKTHIHYKSTHYCEEIVYVLE